MSGAQVALNGTGAGDGDQPEGTNDATVATPTPEAGGAASLQATAAGGLVAADGSRATVAQVVDESDVLVMVATDAAAAGPARLLGDLADRRGLMTVGVVLADPTETQSVVAAMRPHARMLLVSSDATDVPEVLRAFRA